MADPKPIVVQPVPGNSPQPIIIHQRIGTGIGSKIMSWLLFTVLFLSLAANFGLYSSYQQYLGTGDGPTEKFYSGEHLASDKIAIIKVSGTIMGHLTDRVLKDIKQAKDDTAVKGVLLVVDSPGGLISDSHQIYHRLQELGKLKPVFVSMKSLAASGGYYVSMGAGENTKIFAEPTTWTGSIGVIIPYFEASELANKVGIKSEPLKTGKFKDALSPFRELTTDERELWTNILDQAFQQFIDVIAANRKNLPREKIVELATGQIYTAKDALANGLIDAIGFEEDALAELKTRLGVEHARVVTYSHTESLLELLSASGSAKSSVSSDLRALMDAAVPRAMYYFSSVPVLHTSY